MINEKTTFRKKIKKILRRAFHWKNIGNFLVVVASLALLLSAIAPMFY